MSDRLTDRRVVWRALCDAHEYADSIIDAYENVNDEDGKKVKAKQLRLQNAYDRVAKKYYGKGISEAKYEPIRGMKAVPIHELLRMQKEEDSTNE